MRPEAENKLVDQINRNRDFLNNLSSKWKLHYPLPDRDRMRERNASCQPEAVSGRKLPESYGVKSISQLIGEFHSDAKKPAPGIVSTVDAPPDVPPAADEESLFYKKWTDILKIPEPLEPIVCKDTLPDTRALMEQAIEAEGFLELKEYVKEHSDINGFRLYEKALLDYEKFLKKNLDQLSSQEVDFSRTTVRNLCKAVKDKLIDRIMSPVFNRLENGNTAPQYWELIRRMTGYLKNCGFYTYNKAEVAKAMTDEDFDVYEPEAIFVSNPELIDIIKHIRRLPYLISYEVDTRLQTSVIPGDVLSYGN